jgi:hypothetical protein
VLKESFRIYCALNDGIINLVDVFFDMNKLDAIKAQDIYRRTGSLAQSLSEFYAVCRGLELARNFQFPVLREPPPSFLVTMEEYIREAPRTMNVVNKTIEYRQLDFLANQEEDSTPEPPQVAVSEEPAVDELLPELVDDEPQDPAAEAAAVEPEPTTTTFDFLGLHEVSSAAAKLEECNALALAIVAPDRSSMSSVVAPGSKQVSSHNQDGGEGMS